MKKNGHILSFFDKIHFELWIAFFKVFIRVFLTWRLVIKLDILMVQINQYTTLNDQWRWNSKIKNRNWNLIHRNPYQFRTKLGLTFGAIWDFFWLFWRILGVCDILLVGDFTSRDQNPHSNVDPSLKVLVQMSTLPKTWRIFHVEFLRQKLRNVSIAFHWLSISTPPQKLRTKQRTNSHRNYVTFQLPFIGCKCPLLVKRYAQNNE